MAKMKTELWVAIDLAFDHVTTVCAVAGQASQAVVDAVCDLILQYGKHVDPQHTIKAARDGYLQTGRDIPSGYAQTIKRLHLASAAQIKAFKLGAESLNNRNAIAFDLPKLEGTSGRKPNASKDTPKDAPKDVAGVIGYMPDTLDDLLGALRELRSRLPKLTTSGTGEFDDLIAVIRNELKRQKDAATQAGKAAKKEPATV